MESILCQQYLVTLQSTYHYVLYVNILDNLICFKDSWDVKSSDLLLTLPKTLTFSNTIY